MHAAPPLQPGEAGSGPPSIEILKTIRYLVYASWAEQCEPWADPWTSASGLRVPAPLGGALMLRILRETGGGAVAVMDEELEAAARDVTREIGVDMSPEGGAAVAAVSALRQAGQVEPDERVVVFNTGAGWLYRESGGLPQV